MTSREPFIQINFLDTATKIDSLAVAVACYAVTDDFNECIKLNKLEAFLLCATGIVMTD